ncbi:MAG TPA: hypothetical protein VGG99_09945 [Acetobacteraceae bacterium]|jgi:hypothetical protein
MPYPTAIRALVSIEAAQPGGWRARRLAVIAGALVFVFGMAGAVLGARAAFAPPSVAARMFEDIRYSALFTGRDPEATLRKAHLRVRLLMRDFGMTRDQAAAYVARVMIEESGGLCSGI